MIRLRGLLRRSRGEAGYSLIEMLTVLVIMGIVMEALTTLFVRASTAEADMNNRFRSQQNARLALDKMRREIHCADTVTKGTSTSPTGPLAAYYINVTLPSGCATNTTGASLTVTWCTEGSGSRWGVYRISGSTTCTGGTSTCRSTSRLKRVSTCMSCRTTSLSGTARAANRIQDDRGVAQPETVRCR
ncbi:MAG: type II secretion system protein [Actinobacteria bacterium]|nr:MAG: type II secretion system protein [Actinomycetota bacterium]